MADVLFIVPNAGSPASNDVALRDDMVALGHTVTYRTASDAEVADDGTYDVVVISESINSGDNGTKYTAGSWPILLFEGGSFDEFAISTGQTQTNWDGATHEFAIADNGHYINDTSGFAGTNIIVASSGSGIFLQVISGTIAAGFVTLATTGGSPIAGYIEEGGTLVGGGSASSRRIAWGLEEELTATLTADGITYLGAMLNWLIGLDAGSEPAITDVDTDEIVLDGQTGVAVTGTDMGADETERTFDLVQGAVEVEQTETGSGTDTAATLTIGIEQTGADIKFGAAVLRVTRTSDSETGDINVTVNPPSGQIYVDVGTPNTTADNRITASPDIEAGDQIQARGVGGGAVPSGLNLNSDATFHFDSGEDPAPFDVRVWDVNDATWGSWVTQNVLWISDVPTPLSVGQTEVDIIGTGFGT